MENPNDLQHATYETVLSYKELATDSTKQILLLKDEACIQFLVYVLENTNNKIANVSLQTLGILCEKPEQCRILRSIFGVVEGLERLINSDGDEEIIQKAKDVYDSLTRDIRRDCALKDRYNERTPNTAKTSQKRPNFLGTANKRAKTLIFQVSGLSSQPHRKMCEEQLLQVKGVISFTFDMNKRRCIIRTKPEVLPEVIAGAISQTAVMIAEQVVKNKSGEETLISFEKNDISQHKENLELPDYLPEKESPTSDRAVKRQGNAKESTSSWLNSAATFLSKSFYW